MSDDQIGLAILGGAGAVMVLLSLVLRRVPRNRWAGVRLRATFADERVWRETNDRFAAGLRGLGLMVAALAVALLTIAGTLALLAVTVVLLGGLIALAVDAYAFSRRRLAHYRGAAGDAGE